MCRYIYKRGCELPTDLWVIIGSQIHCHVGEKAQYGSLGGREFSFWDGMCRLPLRKPKSVACRPVLPAETVILVMTNVCCVTAFSFSCTRLVETCYKYSLENIKSITDTCKAQQNTQSKIFAKWEVFDWQYKENLCTKRLKMCTHVHTN